MSDSASLEFYKLAEALKQKLATNKLASWKPYPKQKDFMYCKNKIKVMFGANQCLAWDQEIYDPVLKVSRKVSEIDSDFHVEAWDGEKRVVAKAHKPYRKEDDDIYLVTFGSGETIKCTRRHMLMCETGWCELQFTPDNGVSDFTYGTSGECICDTISIPVEELSDSLRLGIALSGRIASGNNQIMTIKMIHCCESGREVWDFEVEGYGNYFIGSILNHNSGKTTTVCAELTYHLTGVYPEGWEGVKYNRPVDIWIAGETNVRVRDTLQEKLFGRPGQMGTGTIPKQYIDVDSIIRKPGIPYAIDIARIKHHTDGIEDGFSTIQFFSYDMKREAFQGSSVDIIEFDEEPPDDINDECKMRVIAKSGRLFYTFTPLKGMTPLWNELNKNEDVGKFWLTWDDITHLKEEDKEALVKGMSEEQIRARKYGVATVGSSQIFQFQEDDYVCDDFQIPKWWPRLGGLDIGVNHPTGAVAAAYDEEADTIYIYREYQKAGGAGAKEHALVLRKWDMPFAIDRSAWQRDKAVTITPASVYEDCGLSLVNAGNVAGTTMPSIIEIRNRILEGRFFIFRSLSMLREQMRLYRTKDNGIDIYKLNDDLIDPMRYVVMNIKSATQLKSGNNDIILPDDDLPFDSYSFI